MDEEEDGLGAGDRDGEPLLAIFKAIWKSVARQAGGVEPAAFGPGGGVAWPARPRAGREYALRLIFAEREPDKVEAWRAALRAHLTRARHNYEVVELGEAEWRTQDHLEAEPLGLDLEARELCLDFLTPMSFNAGEKRKPWLLTEEELRRRVAERWFQTHGERPDLTGLPALEVRPWFWQFDRSVHRSKSQGGTAQFLAGCAGPLYLRGPWQEWLPWWRWLREWHLGKGAANGLGCLRLDTARTCFDRPLLDPGRYEAVLRDLLEQAEGGDADLLRLAADLPAACRELAADFKMRTYQLEPARGFTIPKKDGSTRLITEPRPRDRVMMSVAQAVLRDPLDRLLEEACHGYRPGRGVDTACAAVSAALRNGATHVLEADVEGFFDEMDWRVLETAVDRALPVADTRTRHLLAEVARMPLEVDGRRQIRVKGVLQGATLSPLLANLYLDRFDEQLAQRGHRLVRYGDDLRVLCRGETAARRALADADAILAPLGLRLNAAKTSIRPVDLGLTFLGRNFGLDMDQRLVERRLLRQPLWVVNDWSFVALDGDSVMLKRDNRLLARYPLLRLSELVLEGPHGVSSALLMRCTSQGIPVTFCRTGGRHVSTLQPAGRDWLAAAMRHAERHHTLAEHEIVEQCRALVAAKLGNYVVWFKEKRLPPPIDLDHLVKRLRQAASVFEILGLEGDASRQLFRRVNAQAPTADFASRGRVQRLKSDRWNTLLDAAYTLLFHQLNVLVRSAGLSPFLGFLHSPRNRFESLVCDLQEPFRHRIDRLVLRWLNLGTLRADDFEQEMASNRWQFTREGRVKLVKAWHTALHSSYISDGGLSLRECLQRQVVWLENWVAHGGGLQWFRWPVVR